MEDETTRTDGNNQTFGNGQVIDTEHVPGRGEELGNNQIPTGAPREDDQSPDSDYIPKNNHISRFEHHRLRIFLSLLLVYCATWIGAHALLRSAQGSYILDYLDNEEAISASDDLQNIHKDVLTHLEGSDPGPRPQQTEWDSHPEDSYSPFLWDIIITYLHVSSTDQQIKQETSWHLNYTAVLLSEINGYYTDYYDKD